jgi:raffinose/stachyose/melibiose transport system substrate-binding protein
MFISGTWASEALLAAPTANKFGFFLLPPQTETANNLVIAGTSAAYAIRQDSPNTELAAEYIDWMMSDRAMELWQQAGLLPVVPIDPTTVEPGLYAELIAAWDQVAQSRSIGHYLDWATPTFYDTLIVSLQELGDGLLTPREFTQKLQTDYEAFGHEQ